MKFIFAVLCIAAVAFAATDDSYKAFAEWTFRHERIYSNLDEHAARFEVFKENLALVNHLNRKNVGQFALNKFADMTREEFAAKYLMPPFVAFDHPAGITASNEPNPDDLDWCTKGGCNKIKDQAQCGSCWAFSAVANMEGQYFVAKGTLPNLSEQQLVDCEHDCMIFPGTTEKVCDEGCNGGLMPNAFTYAIREGMMSEQDYPYKGRDQTCKYDAAKATTHFTSWTWVDKNEEAMKGAVTKYGPLSVAVDATYWSYYSGGIYDSSCSSTTMNHGVALVGYGKEGSKDYWIIRNSWGTSWGLKGYMHLVRGKNKCGISNFVCTTVA